MKRIAVMGKKPATKPDLDPPGRGKVVAVGEDPAAALDPKYVRRECARCGKPLPRRPVARLCVACGRIGEPRS